MKNKTPFLPGISATLYGRQKRHQLEKLRLEREKARQYSIGEYSVLFDDILPAEILEKTAAQERRRVFPEVITFWAWVSQILGLNASCSKAVTLVQSWYQSAGIPLPSCDSSAFCRARKRISDRFLDTVDELIQEHTKAHEGEGELWHGFRVKAIDGTSVKLMDTPENQAEFPQPCRQKVGCGFPVMGLVGVIKLGTGQLSDYIICDHRAHDAKGAFSLLPTFAEGDLVLGDRGFYSYEFIGKALESNVESVMRLHQARETKIDWRRGKKLSHNSRLVVWKRPFAPRKSGITREEWNQLPREMTIRIVRAKITKRDGKPSTIYIATTLLDSKVYSDDEIAKLYAERWKIEVKFRDIKTTMQFEELRVRTPEMARKTIRMIQLVYNLIKARQQSAIRGRRIPIDHLGFKATVDVIVEFRSSFSGLLHHPRLQARTLERLGLRIEERLLRIRPGRSEPRVIKRRPKPFAYLTAPRDEYVEIQHRSRYRKAA